MKPASKLPFQFRETTPFPHGENDATDEGSVKFADYSLVDADGAEIIPLRMDHYNPIWDQTHEDWVKHAPDRAYLVHAANLYPELVKALDLLITSAEACRVEINGMSTAPQRAKNAAYSTLEDLRKARALLSRCEGGK